MSTPLEPSSSIHLSPNLNQPTDLQYAMMNSIESFLETLQSTLALSAATSSTNVSSAENFASPSSEMMLTTEQFLTNFLLANQPGGTQQLVQGLSGYGSTMTAPQVYSANASQAFPQNVPDNIQSAITTAAQKYGVPETLIRGVIQQESGMDPTAVSSAGAMGLMQLMPGTAVGFGVKNAYDPVQNVDAGTHYLANLLHRYNGNVSLALAAYNAGPGAVDKYGGIPPYNETEHYVQRVMHYAGIQI